MSKIMVSLIDSLVTSDDWNFSILIESSTFECPAAAYSLLDFVICLFCFVVNKPQYIFSDYLPAGEISILVLLGKETKKFTAPKERLRSKREL